ncbi:prolipoprotein diacylglyceryl transferase [Chromatiales bacterium (ex Bugula neritina AB1)]|nr:prolipoprotein diacylglyceryl transferase [Chromatiales bacterium (ex Bugula neritina AB1)]
MLEYPNINAVAIEIGPLKVHWYGLMYLVGFVAAWWLLKIHTRRLNTSWSKDDLADLIFYAAIGVILGGRLGYIFFYNFSAFVSDPLMILKIWQGGMSFHGGFIGVIVSVWIFARKTGRALFEVGDLVAPVSAVGLGAGRVGNFINGELWGRVTDVPWGMVFPFEGAGTLPRHPSQLYQFFLEGVLLFLILWIYSRKPRPMMAVSGMFLLLYGVFRFFVEFFRQPDEHLLFVAFNWMTRGQQLCIPMILLGGFLIWLAYRRGQYAHSTAAASE